MRETDSGLLVPEHGSFLLDELASVEQQHAREISLGELGLCYDCPAIATVPCPDGCARCRDHARVYAAEVVRQADDARRYVHRLSPAGKKARARRRAKRKATKR